MDKSPNKLAELKGKEKQYKEKLKAKRLLLGKSDGAMESRFPTERFELESDIKVLEIMLGDIRQEIVALQRVRPSPGSDPVKKGMSKFA